MKYFKYFFMGLLIIVCFHVYHNKALYISIWTYMTEDKKYRCKYYCSGNSKNCVTLISYVPSLALGSSDIYYIVDGKQYIKRPSIFTKYIEFPFETEFEIIWKNNKCYIYTNSPPKKFQQLSDKYKIIIKNKQ